MAIGTGLVALVTGIVILTGTPNFALVIVAVLVILLTSIGCLTDVTFSRRYITGILLIPALWLVLFWSLVVRARFDTGVWPYPQSDHIFEDTSQYPTIDPSSYGIHSALVGWGLLLTAIAICVAVLLLLVSIGLHRIRPPASIYVVGLASLAATVSVVIFDVGHDFSWFVVD